MTCQIPNLADLYRKYLPETGYLVEVGAYDGVTYSNSIELLRSGWKGLMIEPVRAYANRCRENLNGLDVTVLNVACGSGTGKVRIERREEYSCIGQTVSTDWMKEPEGVETVRVVTLDSVLGDGADPDLLIIDCEGYEFEVLKGYNPVTLPRMVIIELHEGASGTCGWSALPGYQEAIDLAYSKLAGMQVVYRDEINPVFVRTASYRKRQNDTQRSGAILEGLRKAECPIRAVRGETVSRRIGRVSQKLG